MMLTDNSTARTFELLGMIQRTLAGPETGLSTLEVWHVTFPPRAEPFPFHHDGEIVLMVLQGRGRAITENHSFDLCPETTLSIPPNVSRAIINRGDDELVLLAVRGLKPSHERLDRD